MRQTSSVFILNFLIVRLLHFQAASDIGARDSSLESLVQIRAVDFVNITDTREYYLKVI